MTTRLLRTIFLTSVFSYVGFAFIDYVEPGVVSDVMSVHLWLLPIIVSGIFWALRAKNVESPSRGYEGPLAAFLLGLVLGIVFWHNGNMFGDFRLLLALSTAALPMIALRAIKQ